MSGNIGNIGNIGYIGYSQPQHPADSGRVRHTGPTQFQPGEPNIPAVFEPANHPGHTPKKPHGL